jgi:hypothetical protein
LWLGISGVGSLVVIAATALVLGVPQSFSRAASLGIGEGLQLLAVIGLYMAWLVPLDFLGGYWLPKRHEKTDLSFSRWLKIYAKAALLQAVVFALCGSLIVFLGQSLGRGGSLLGIAFLTVIGWYVRNLTISWRATDSPRASDRMREASTLLTAWQLEAPRLFVVDHTDRGYTGGIIGLGKHATIVIPRAWLSFGSAELATALARRVVAIRSGSYTRGLVLAFAWNFFGFWLCSLAPEDGLASIAGLVTTLCLFTLWSFLGLLTLPTVSRNASLLIDDELVRRGVPLEWVAKTASSMDQLQDDEPARPRWIETIFHPVPSVQGRSRPDRGRGIGAWNVARTTLFFAWPCLGLLSRSVHCNLGRPELWTMLPTD